MSKWAQDEFMLYKILEIDEENQQCMGVYISISEEFWFINYPISGCDEFDIDEFIYDRTPISSTIYSKIEKMLNMLIISARALVDSNMSELKEPQAKGDCYGNDYSVIMADYFDSDRDEWKYIRIEVDQISDMIGYDCGKVFTLNGSLKEKGYKSLPHGTLDKIDAMYKRSFDLAIKTLNTIHI